MRVRSGVATWRCFATCLAIALLLGCAGAPLAPAPGDGARAEIGMSLEQALSVVRRGSGARQHRWVSSESLLRLDREPWQRMELAAEPLLGEVALVTHVWCRLEFDGREYEGRAVSWYLLHDGRISAMDHYDFGARCSLENDYRPARPEQAALERELAARYLSEPPELAAFQLYGRGLALADAGRASEARELLQRADQQTGGADSFARRRLLEELARRGEDR